MGITVLVYIVVNHFGESSRDPWITSATAQKLEHYTTVIKFNDRDFRESSVKFFPPKSRKFLWKASRKWMDRFLLLSRYQGRLLSAQRTFNAALDKSSVDCPCYCFITEICLTQGPSKPLPKCPWAPFVLPCQKRRDHCKVLVERRDFVRPLSCFRVDRRSLNLQLRRPVDIYDRMDISSRRAKNYRANKREITHSLQWPNYMHRISQL